MGGYKRNTVYFVLKLNETFTEKMYWKTSTAVHELIILDFKVQEAISQFVLNILCTTSYKFQNKYFFKLPHAFSIGLYLSLRKFSGKQIFSQKFA